MVPIKNHLKEKRKFKLLVTEKNAKILYNQIIKILNNAVMLGGLLYFPFQKNS